MIKFLNLLVLGAKNIGVGALALIILFGIDRGLYWGAQFFVHSFPKLSIGIGGAIFILLLAGWGIIMREWMDDFRKKIYFRRVNS